MKKHKTATNFELFRCRHVGALDEVCAKEPLGQIIFVGIGSALSIEDTPALHLVRELSRVDRKVCAVNLEHNFSLLPELVRTHRSIYIVDSFSSDGPTGNILILPLDGEILDRKRLDEEDGFHFSSTHAISWFDELKLARLRGPVKENITFIGIESNIAFEPERAQKQHFDHALKVVQSILASERDELAPISVLPCGNSSNLC